MEPEGARAASPCVQGAYLQWKAELWSGRVPPEHLALTAGVSRDLEANGLNSPVVVCLRRLAGVGNRVPGGQAVRYVIGDRRHRTRAKRYVPKPRLAEVRDYHAKSYEGLLQDVHNEVMVVRDETNRSPRALPALR